MDNEDFSNQKQIIIEEVNALRNLNMKLVHEVHNLREQVIIWQTLYQRELNRVLDINTESDLDE